MSKNKQNCRNCLYWKPDDGPEDIGLCDFSFDSVCSVVPFAFELEKVSTYGDGGANCPCFQKKKEPKQIAAEDFDFVLNSIAEAETIMDCGCRDGGGNCHVCLGIYDNLVKSKKILEKSN
jgi:hypothetical protein